MKITDLFAPFADELQLAATPSLSNPPLVEWTSGFGDIFFRIRGADQQIVWCVLGRGAPTQRPLSKARLATLNKYVSAAYAGRTFFRVVPFSDGDDWALVRPKRALVKSAMQKKGAVWQWSADFPAPQGQIEWLSQPLVWFENWLPDLRALQAPREFAQLSDFDRQWLALTRESETPQKWETLTPALQKLVYQALDSRSMEWHLFGHNVHSVPVYPLFQWDHLNSAFRPAGATPILELIGMLQAWHPLQYQGKLWRGIGVRGKKESHRPPSYKATQPSQHEKLEAALLWRDFGRETGESQRVEAALAQLLQIE